MAELIFQLCHGSFCRWAAATLDSSLQNDRPESFKSRSEATVDIKVLLKSMMLVQHHVSCLFGGRFLRDVFMFVSIHVVI